MLLACNHPAILSFRMKMDKLFNMKQLQRTNYLNTFGDEQFTISAIHNMNKTFIDLGTSHIGKLKQNSTTCTYPNIKTILNLFHCKSIQQCFDKNKPIRPLIFGMPTFKSTISKNDNTIGITDAIWLGLIPTKLNNTMVDIYTRLSQRSSNIQFRGKILKLCSNLWK